MAHRRSRAPASFVFADEPVAVRVVPADRIDLRGTARISPMWIRTCGPHLPSHDVPSGADPSVQLMKEWVFLPLDLDQCLAPWFRPNRAPVTIRYQQRSLAPHTGLFEELK